MYQKFDLKRRKHRDLLTGLIGDIYLYARDNDLLVVQCVRDIAECFYEPEKRPCNDLVRNHESFVAIMFARTAKKAGGNALQNLSFFKDVAKALDEVSDESINDFVLMNDTLAELHAKGDTQTMDAIFSEMEKFNREMRKYI